MNITEWTRDRLISFAKKSTEWRISRDDTKNKDYYYNKVTKKSQWEAPEVLADFEKQLISEYKQIHGLIEVHIVDETLLSIELEIAGEEGEQMESNKRQKTEFTLVDNTGDTVVRDK